MTRSTYSIVAAEKHP